MSSKHFIWAIIIIIQSLCFSKILSSSVSSSSSRCPHHLIHQGNRKFEQKATKFWEFDEESKTWVQVKLPYDVVYCVNHDGNCVKVGSIDDHVEEEEGNRELIDQTAGFAEDEKGKTKDDHRKKKKKDKGCVYSCLSQRKRVSLTKMSDTSIWVTGESGSIYERFWNGLQWVIAPHDLPVQAGYAVSVFIVNQTILALSEAGIMYQLQLGENSQPTWVEFMPILDHNTVKDKERDMAVRLSSGVLSHDRERVYFCTKNGLLLELNEANLPRWVTLGKPPGADVAAIADAASIRPQVIFTVSSTGDLYEFDRGSKPIWKKHIWSEELAKETALTPSTGCALHGVSGTHSISLFLLTKGGNLVERRLHQRKWKWIVHGSPEDHQLTSITPASLDEATEKSFSLFLTTSSGLVYEYHIPKQQGNAQANQARGTWVNHMHPMHSKAAKGVAGLQFQTGRIIFPLDDGRLGELHLPGVGGEGVGPVPHTNTRRRASAKYVWSILDAPESEGWNAEYCTEERGPVNCIVGVKDEYDDDERGPQIARSASRRRTGSRAQEQYYPCSPASVRPKEEPYSASRYSGNNNFRLRVMHQGRSFFLVTEDGLVFEYISAENVWFWLKHEHSVAMRGALGNYNGSLFLVNENKDLMIRERTEKELSWINCMGMKKGRQVIGGPPWDLLPGKTPKATIADSLFFVSKTGKLLQLTVAMKNFKWKDCRSPLDTKITSIIDQEELRENIVFVVGRNGKLYQYNKVTELWHGHHQSQHMILSRNPGTAMRPWSKSLSGSLFMLSEDGKLIEYQWSSIEGSWEWVEHGTPQLGVTLVGSTGPCFRGNQLFLIGSDGRVYIRYLDQATWKWGDCGFPGIGKAGAEIEEICIEPEIHRENIDQTDNCDSKVAPTRPIPFMEDSVIFELRDGRLAEMRQTENRRWVWQRTIGTPTSHCNVNYWTTMAS